MHFDWAERHWFLCFVTDQRKCGFRHLWCPGVQALGSASEVVKSEDVMFEKVPTALIAIAAAFIPEIVCSQTTVEDRLALDQPPVVIAHRAVVGDVPDNSLAGIQNAIDRGVDMVEVDVQPVSDGQYILMHENNLIDMTDVKEVFPEGAPSRGGSSLGLRHLTNDYSLEEISRLRLKSAEGEVHPVATLEAALQLARGQVLLALELKRWETDSLVALLEQHDTSNVVLFSQFEPAKLQATAEAAGIAVWALANSGDENQDIAVSLERYGTRLKLLQVKASQLTPGFVDKLESLGVRALVKGSAKEDRGLIRGDASLWQEAVNAGAGALLTGYPDEVLTLLGR